jgi:hypothetical protein
MEILLPINGLPTMNRAGCAARQEPPGAFRRSAGTTAEFLAILAVMSRAAWALFVGLLVAMPALAAELLPHRATFTLSLRPGGAPNILGVIGRIAFAYEAACDGAITRHAMHTLIRDAGGRVTDSRATMLLWERADGIEMTFETTATYDERPDAPFTGRALLSAGAPGRVTYEVPGGTFQLRPGTVFPTEHSRDVLAAAMRGERMLTQDVFQGGGPTNYMTVTAAIGDPLPADATDPALAGRRSWPVREAYYRPGGFNELPEHEFGFRLYEGGLIDALDLDFGPFRVTGKLVSLEMLSAPRC